MDLAAEAREAAHDHRRLRVGAGLLLRRRRLDAAAAGGARRARRPLHRPDRGLDHHGEERAPGRHRPRPRRWASATRWSSRTSSSARASPPTRPTAATTARPSCWRSPGPPPSAWACARCCWGPTSTTSAITAPACDAADERGARQPMVDAGLTKAEVRALSRELGLPTWDKPQLACLSSRFPYGTEITPERLRAGRRASRTACARSASASCACATTARWPASSSRTTPWAARSTPRSAGASSTWARQWLHLRRARPGGFRLGVAESADRSAPQQRALSSIDVRAERQTDRVKRLHGASAGMNRVISRARALN